MTVKEALTAWGVTPSADYTGEETADDFILGIQTETTQTSPENYTVCQVSVSEHSAALNASTSDKQYIRSGTNTLRTSVQRTFSVSGDRFAGDPFQNFVLSHKIRYGIGSDVKVTYVWFSVRTGKGEKGTAMINVTADASGGAGNDAGFACELRSTGRPEEYTYSAS